MKTKYSTAAPHDDIFSVPLCTRDGWFGSHGSEATQSLVTAEGGDKATANITITTEDSSEYDIDPRGDMEAIVTQGDITVFDDDGIFSPSDDRLRQMWTLISEAPAMSSQHTLNERSICVDDEVKARFGLRCDWGTTVECTATFMVHEGTECLPDDPTPIGSRIEDGDVVQTRQFTFARSTPLGFGEGADTGVKLNAPDEEGSFASFGFRTWKRITDGAPPGGD